MFVTLFGLLLLFSNKGASDGRFSRRRNKKATPAFMFFCLNKLRNEPLGENLAVKCAELYDEFQRLHPEERAKFDVKQMKDSEHFEREYSQLHNRPGDGYHYFVKRRFLDHGYYLNHQNMIDLFNKYDNEWHSTRADRQVSWTNMAREDAERARTALAAVAGPAPAGPPAAGPSAAAAADPAAGPAAQRDRQEEDSPRKGYPTRSLGAMTSTMHLTA